MKDSKWLADLSPNMPAAAAARIALAARLKAVRRRFDRVTAGDATAEDVHQLRVATRRAAAAVAIFGPLLDKKRARRARRVLRAVRRAAGGVRDFDVFGDRLARSAATPAGYALAGYAAGRRAAAEADLTAVARTHGRKLDKVCRRTSDGVDSDNADPFATVAVAALSDLFARLTAAATNPPTAADELHVVRIVGKQVRYAMELFAPCFGPPFRVDLYPAVVRLQEILGVVQDGDVAILRLAEAAGHLIRSRPELAADVGEAVEAARDDIHARTAAVTGEFANWAAAWSELVGRYPLAELVSGGSAGPSPPR